MCFNFQGGGGVPGSPPVEIHFTVPVTKVGMWFGTSSSSTFTIEVYNGGTLLESLTKRGTALGAFGLEGFAGLERPELITMVKVFSRSDNVNFGPFNFSIDDVRFEGEEPCYPDCDTSTGPGVLDIFDFLCFGNRFAANDPYACDCDTTTGPGVCDIFDFLCFGNAFNAGCP